MAASLDEGDPEWSDDEGYAEFIGQDLKKEGQDSKQENLDSKQENQESKHKQTGKLEQSQTSTIFSILHKQGDLFGCPRNESLVHCVSRDLRMGKGIATLFKEKFAGVTELKSQDKRVGDVAVLKREGRFVYYLITKEKYNNKPTYTSFEASLLSMKKHCVKNGVTQISMPRIGCGLDKLNWSKVEDILRKLFSDTDIVMTVYSFR